MANHERGRSPSAGQANRLNTAASALPQPPQDASFADISLQYNGLGAQPQTVAFNNTSFDQTENYFLGQQTASLGPQSNNFSDHAFLQSQGFEQGNTAGLNYPQGTLNNVWSSGIGYDNQSTTNEDSIAFPDFNQIDYSENNSLDPSLLEEFDPHPPQNNVPSLDPMATSIQPNSPTPPHLLPDMGRRQSNSPSPNHSPIFQQQQSFGSDSRPRNTSVSLDPSSAMFPQGQNEWAYTGAYRTHRRTPSDQYSDYSSHHSNQASPYMQTFDSFESHSSPLLNPQQDPTFNDGLGLGQFSLSENQPPPQHNYPSPGHSPRISPQLVPQQPLPQFVADNGYSLSHNQFNQQSNGLDMFPSLSKPQSPSDFGQADQMSPPEINVEFAPPAMTLNHNIKLENDGEALSPPARSKSIW